ncbi:MAG TPA: MFS transporter [Ktedonobacteraceae bacterium]|nr:MFS transporter [Ktedonobacteraceae bacterium]
MFYRLRLRRLKKLSFLRLTLLSMGLLDELITGFEFVALPLLRDQLGLSYQQVGLLFSVAALSGLIFEPFLNLLSDRGSKRWWILGGLLGLTIGFALIGSTRNYILLLGAFALTYPCGIAVDLSQAALIDSAPASGARTMTRWTLMCGIGDLLSPLVVAAFVAAGLGWTTLCWSASLVWLIAGVVIWFQRFPTLPTPAKETGSSQVKEASSIRTEGEVNPAEAQAEDIPEVSLLAGLRAALRDPILLRWAALSILPTMLDEVFLGFATLYLKDVLHASEVAISACIVVHMLGVFPSLLVIDRIVERIAPHKLLIGLSLITLVGAIGFLTLHSVVLAAVSLFVIGLGEAGLYPVAMAEAYARQPGRSGTVRVIVGLGQPFEILLPGFIGLVAARFGVLASVGLLCTAPLWILLLLPWRKPGHKAATRLEKPAF